MTLARALDATSPSELLDALLGAWEKAPSPAIAELVALASNAGELPEIRGKTKRAIEAWRTLGRAPKSTDVPALLASLTDVLWRDAYARLCLVKTWRPDPRVDEALVRMLETLPYRSTSKPFYTEVIALLSRARDAALVARIEEARDAVPELMSATLGDWLERRIDELLRNLRSTIAKPRKPPVEASRLRERLEQSARERAPRTELGDLLTSIHEQPDDLGRRLVYADALLERGDARGELISLQCHASPTPEQQRRAAALVKAHGLQWLGELAPILAKGWKFERGFLAACRVDSNKGTRIRPLVGHPAWSTVHTLADSAQIALHPIMRSLRTLEFRPNRTRQREQLEDAWRELLAGTPRGIERLHYTDLDMYEDREEQLALLGACSALPALRELRVGGITCFHTAELLASPIAARLETLGFVFEHADPIPPTLLGASLRTSKIRRLLVQHPGVTITLERGAAEIERARIVVGDGVREACGAIAGLPSSLRELRVETPEGLERGALVALTIAARTLTALDVREIGPQR